MMSVRPRILEELCDTKRVVTAQTEHVCRRAAARKAPGSDNMRGRSGIENAGQWAQTRQVHTRMAYLGRKIMLGRETDLS